MQALKWSGLKTKISGKGRERTRMLNVHYIFIKGGESERYVTKGISYCDRSSQNGDDTKLHDAGY